MTDRVRVSDGKSWSKDKFMLKALKPEISLMQECVETAGEDSGEWGDSDRLGLCSWPKPSGWEGTSFPLSGLEEMMLESWRCLVPDAWERKNCTDAMQKVCVGCSVYPSALTQAKISCEFRVRFLLLTSLLAGSSVWEQQTHFSVYLNSFQVKLQRGMFLVWKKSVLLQSWGNQEKLLG